METLSWPFISDKMEGQHQAFQLLKGASLQPPSPFTLQAEGRPRPSPKEKAWDFLYGPQTGLQYSIPIQVCGLMIGQKLQIQYTKSTADSLKTIEKLIADTSIPINSNVLSMHFFKPGPWSIRGFWNALLLFFVPGRLAVAVC